MKAQFWPPNGSTKLLRKGVAVQALKLLVKANAHGQVLSYHWIFGKSEAWTVQPILLKALRTVITKEGKYCSGSMEMTAAAVVLPSASA